MRLQFLGATDTVTGSRFVLDTGRSRVMVDCGLFQGYKALRLRNWDRLPVEPSSLDAVVLTHAHLDHSGYVPLLVKNGFRGRVYCTAGTAQLCGILWPDSAHLAEEDAAYANRKHFSRHQPALPLYQTADVARALRRLELVSFHQRRRVTDDIDVEFSRAGHIIGSAVVTLHVNGRQIVFSGDLGRQQDLVMRPPEPIEHADVLLVESTYGNRAHPSDDPRDTFGAAVTRTVERGGTVIVPAFAVGRTQTILYCLKWLRDQGRLPFVPVYLNSPLAINATKIFALHPEDLRLDRDQIASACELPILVKSTDESIALNKSRAPKIIIAGSGMATGGRVVHHIEHFGGDARNSILLCGFQAAGTRGAALAEGARSLRIHGRDVAIEAEVIEIENLSAHADAQELLGWLGTFAAPPRNTFIVHGEPPAADALRQQIERRLRWHVTMPEYRESYDLG